MTGAARWLSFYWSPERQEVACDGERFAHPMATNTAASHDVAHLLAAASWLPWKPKGTRDEISTAEFNAVLLEHLANNVLSATLLGRGSLDTVLARTLEHARWFVEVHYAPFACSFDEALSRLARGLDVVTVARLAPVFFRARIFELEHEDHRARTLAAAFSSRFDAPCGRDLQPVRAALAGELEALVEGAHVTRDPLTAQSSRWMPRGLLG